MQISFETDKRKNYDSLTISVSGEKAGKVYIHANGLVSNLIVYKKFRGKKLSSALVKEIVRLYPNRLIFGYASAKIGKTSTLIEYYKKIGFSHTGRAKITLQT